MNNAGYGSGMRMEKRWFNCAFSISEIEERRWTVRRVRAGRSTSSSTVSRWTVRIVRGIARSVCSSASNLSLAGESRLSAASASQ